MLVVKTGFWIRWSDEAPVDTWAARRCDRAPTTRTFQPLFSLVSAAGTSPADSEPSEEPECKQEAGTWNQHVSPKRAEDHPEQLLPLNSFWTSELKVCRETPQKFYKIWQIHYWADKTKSSRCFYCTSNIKNQQRCWGHFKFHKEVFFTNTGRKSTGMFGFSAETFVHYSGVSHFYSMHQFRLKLKPSPCRMSSADGFTAASWSFRCFSPKRSKSRLWTTRGLISTNWSFKQ